MIAMKKPSIVKTSAETIGHSQELLTLILLRVPTKPLLKFKCVSKQWLSLISNPDFCLSHTRHLHHQINGFHTPTALVLKWLETSPSEIDWVPLKHNTKVPSFDFLGAPNINVLQSCYGLFLCASMVESFPVYIYSTYFICNPTTKKFKELYFPTTDSPSVSGARTSFSVPDFYVNLAFDPLKSPHYKIISIRQASHEPPKFELDVYSSKIDDWSVARISFSVKKPIRFEDAVFCNGKIHWKSYWSESLYFDVENESLEPLPMPISTAKAPAQNKYLGESQGVLYAVVTYKIDICQELEVFEMASDYCHWLLKHRLYIGDVPKHFPHINWKYYAPGFTDVCFTQLKKEEKPKVVVWRKNKVISYDFEDGTWKPLYDIMPGVELETIYKNSHLVPFKYQSIHAYKYFENLSSI